MIVIIIIYNNNNDTTLAVCTININTSFLLHNRTAVRPTSYYWCVKNGDAEITLARFTMFYKHDQTLTLYNTKLQIIVYRQQYITPLKVRG